MNESKPLDKFSRSPKDRKIYEKGFAYSHSIIKKNVWLISNSMKLIVGLKTKKSHAFPSGLTDTTIKAFIHTISY
jgi:hypothetical protein